MLRFFAVLDFYYCDENDSSNSERDFAIRHKMSDKEQRRGPRKAAPPK